MLLVLLLWRTETSLVYDVDSVVYVFDSFRMSFTHLSL